jgi:hypothetical protein
MSLCCTCTGLSTRAIVLHLDVSVYKRLYCILPVNISTIFTLFDSLGMVCKFVNALGISIMLKCVNEIAKALKVNIKILEH